MEEFFVGCEPELIAASGVLEQLYSRMVRVRRGGVAPVDLMALRERRIAAMGDRDDGE